MRHEARFSNSKQLTTVKEESKIQSGEKRKFQGNGKNRKKKDGKGDNKNDKLEKDCSYVVKWDTLLINVRASRSASYVTRMDT